MSEVAVIVLSWNGGSDLAACLAALARQTVAVDLLVVDNGSRDGSLAYVHSSFPQAELIENGRNLGFSGGMNVGLRALAARTRPPRFAVLLNQDAIVAADWLEQLVLPLRSDPAIAAVGCKIYEPDGITLQHAGIWLDQTRAVVQHLGRGQLDHGQYDHPAEREYVTAAAIGLRMAALDQTAAFDEGYTPAYYEDIDLCWRLRRDGWRIWYTPAASLRHAEARSSPDPLRRAALVDRNRLQFVLRRWPVAQILTAFWPAEQLRLATIPPGIEARALRRAYLAATLEAPRWIAARLRERPQDTRYASQLLQISSGLRHQLSMQIRLRAITRPLQEER